ncbi:MAG: ABC transporter substrate-binding protein, partial [Gammaproteobacteria bacterium]|nr:ABC transporter substrate-binding protein [Gammaproteobacteria bacterium]
NTITWQELHENGAANGLKPENGQLLQEFEAIKTAILKATSKRGHTHFKQQGLQVKFIPPADPADGPKLVAAAKADIAIDYQPQLTMQVARGLPLVRIGTLVNHPLNCLIVLKDGPIHTIVDLKGQLIAHPGGFSEIMLKSMLASQQLTLNDVKLISVHEDLVQALLAGKVAAFTDGMRNFEPIEMKLAGKPARIFLPENYGVPHYDELVLVANKNRLSDPRLKKFILAVQQGTNYLIHHPQSTWQQFAKNHPELNNSLNHDAWFQSLHYFSLQPQRADKARYQQFAEFLKKQGAIKQVPAVDDYVVELF